MRAAIAITLLLAACSEKPAPVATPAPSPAFPALDLAFATPASWIREAPENRLRKAQYRVPAKEKGPGALLVVTHFASSMSTESLVEMWERQVEGSTANPETIQGALRSTFVDLAGTYTPDGGDAIPNARLLAACVETPDGPWFFKLYGPAETVAALRGDFIAMMKSAKKIE